LQDLPGEIRSHRILAGHVRRITAKRIELACHLVLHDPDLGFVNDLGERGVKTGEKLIGFQ